MGYTHYWQQMRDFTAAEWSQVSEDIAVILKHAQYERGIALAGGAGDGGTSPELTPTRIAFNGLGRDSHETMIVYRHRPPKDEWQTVRGSDFCKTERKPYDAAVTAVLCYLSTITRADDPSTGEPIIGSEVFQVSSDGDGSDFLDGLALARAALPGKANQLDLPMDIMRDDRWCAPWLSGTPDNYQVRFCVDGHGYVMNKAGESYRFDSHLELAQWLERHKRAAFRRGGRGLMGSYGPVEENIWKAYGSFDKARCVRIARAQAARLATLFPARPEHAHQPPAYIRPGDMPANAGREFCYHVADLLALYSAKAA